jgi:hypothetical protein
MSGKEQGVLWLRPTVYPAYGIFSFRRPPGGSYFQATPQDSSGRATSLNRTPTLMPCHLSLPPEEFLSTGNGQGGSKHQHRERIESLCGEYHYFLALVLALSQPACIVAGRV